jgi:multiple sugar transport system substrate-binding protein
MSLPWMRKSLAALTALAAVSAFPAMAQDVKPLVFWERSGGNEAFVKILIAAWNEKNPNRPIEMISIPSPEMVPKLAQAIASGEVPDLMGMDLIYGPQFEAAGQLEDITDKIKDWPELKTASPGHMMVSTYENRLYGVPLYADVSVLYWNKRLFKAAGLDPEVGPASLGEIEEMSRKITGIEPGAYGYFLAGNCAGCNIFTFAPLIWANGGTVEPKDANDEPLTGDAVKKVFEWARKMHKDGLIAPEARAVSSEDFHLQLAKDKYAIFGSGNFNLALLKDQNPPMFDAVGVGLLPGFEKGQVASFAGGDIVTIPKGSKRVDDAVEFMKFILSDESQLELYAKNLNMTTRGDMAKNKYFDAVPLVQKMAEAVAVAKTPYTLKFFELINSPQGPWLQGLQRVYFSDDPIDTIIADMKAQMKAIAAE